MDRPLDVDRKNIAVFTPGLRWSNLPKIKRRTDIDFTLETR